MCCSSNYMDLYIFLHSTAKCGACLLWISFNIVLHSNFSTALLCPFSVFSFLSHYSHDNITLFNTLPAVHSVNFSLWLSPGKAVSWLDCGVLAPRGVLSPSWRKSWIALDKNLESHRSRSTESLLVPHLPLIVGAALAALCLVFRRVRRCDTYSIYLPPCPELSSCKAS